jgi:hypothetical protein
MDAESYPSEERQRFQLFAFHYTKALFSSEAIRIAGRDAVLLVAFIASREDHLRYGSAPRFWRTEVMERFGIRSPKDLIRIRNRAIEAGLLAYKEGDRMTPASYWVLVPPWLTDHINPFPKRNEFGNGKPVCRSQNGTGSGTDVGTDVGTHSTPNPIPNPKDTGAAVAAVRVQKKSRKKTRPEYGPGFNDFWSAYPRKVAKLDAVNEYTEAVQRIQDKKGISIEAVEAWLVDRAKAYARSVAGKDQEYIAHPARWLKKDRFDDDLGGGVVGGPVYKDLATARRDLP